MAAAQLKPCPSRSHGWISLRVARNPGGVPPGLHDPCKGGAIAPLHERSEHVRSTLRKPRLAGTHAFLLVLGLPAQKIDRMGKQICHGFQRLNRACWTSREIENQALTAHTTNSAA